MTLPVTLAASASLGTINLWLGLRIFRMRLRDNVLIGDGGGDLLAGRMRTQANLVEYAPFQRAASGRCDPDMARVGVLGRVGRADCSRCRLMRPHCLSLKGHIMALPLIVLLPAANAATIPAVPLERKIVSLALANSLTGAAIASCRTVGREAVVAVVDRGGNLVSLQRGDDIGPHNTLAAQRKAFTALSTKASTTVLAERAATDPTSRNLVTIPELLLLGGGMPIVVNGDVIGGIGVAGSGGSANDERCATEAIAQVIGKSRTHP